MYSSEYTSGFSGPAALHLAAPPSLRHEGNVGQAPSYATMRAQQQERSSELEVLSSELEIMNEELGIGVGGSSGKSRLN
jgi:hypothetical protein